MEKNLNWAVLGTGVIANEMAQALKAMGKTLYAVGNRTHEKAVTFAEKYQVAKVYDDFHEMFTDPDVDVIYITTPHNTHIGFVKEALKNKKHVLCEKSITLNSLELEEALALAKENDVIFEELFTCDTYVYLWKGHPLAQRDVISMKELQEYPCLVFEQGKNNSFYFAEEMKSTYEYKKMIHARSAATAASRSFII